MQYIKRPSTAIQDDAYSIADAMIYRHDQNTRLSRAMQTHGLMSDKVQQLSNDICRLDGLIQDRELRWIENYGFSMQWFQYLDGHPRYNSIQKILEVA
ncbi:hypothetical protein UFOVP631_26 [uncultured Caudovirales phage]|uniref:Uncharacterized protein n=1 Tax=uncultured Caudovirales phage TaxID=2100421 RepID=A0A6J5NAX3_9CAUD|nr:hypothetical protein UFOVP631_26 [uncultured Caudovirales phage]